MRWRGEIGELCIRGPYLMQRYYGRSREECFDADGWFRTGDLVRTDSDGLFYFLGRAGSMIKTAGANVSPAEVERAIAKVAGGWSPMSSGSRMSDRGQMVAAVVAGRTAPPSTSGAARPTRGGTVGIQDSRRFAACAAPMSSVVQRQSRCAHLRKLFDG